MKVACPKLTHIMANSKRKRQRNTLAFIGIVISIFAANASCLSITCSSPRALPTLLSASESPEPPIHTLGVHYSYPFQRHVVKDGEKVLESFEFLDDAREAYPSASLVPVGECAIVAGGGTEETTAYPIDCDAHVDVDSIIKAMPLNDDVAAIVKERIPLERFAGFTPERVRANFQQFLAVLESKLHLTSVAAAIVVNNFPQVLLYSPKLVEERLDFLLAPTPPNNGKANDELDWPLLASQGFGTGWTIEQLRQALQAVPHVVLAMHLEDAFAMKPSLVFFLSALQVSYQDVDRVRLELDEWGDIYTFAYLHGTVGLDWRQLRIMLQAFPCLAICSTEPTWEMISGKSKTRSVLLEDSLHYLQRRLQVGPNTVEAMIKTHPKLSSYSVDGKLIPTLNALQEKLGLSSSELRRVILRMPSLVGMSVVESPEKGLMQRLVFFQDEVGMTQNELRKAVLKEPSLLHYSVDNSLRPKLKFFVDELKVPLADIPSMITRYPALWRLSLSETLRPKANSLMDRCGFARKEFGEIISRVPSILGLSWKRNLEPKMEYLQTRLGLSQRQLKKLIATTPRVLLHSVKSSLEPKLQMVKAALGGTDAENAATKVVAKNPALLVINIAGLQRRLESSLNDASTTSTSKAVERSLRRRSRGLARRKRPVLELDPDSGAVVREFPNVSVAAKELKTSLPNMYSICQTGRLFNGKKFVYGSLPEHDEPVNIVSVPKSSLDETKAQHPKKKKKPLEFKDLKSALTPSDYHPPRLSPGENATIQIIVYTSGRVYPPDSSTQVRGTRRAGGMVLWFPQINKHESPELALRLRLAAKKSFGQIMPQKENGTFYNEGRILIGFPYLRPSRNRCELYACHEAIKVVAQLLKHESTLVSLEKESVQVGIYTDSDYAWKLLHNATRLVSWGAIEEEKDFVYDGPGPAWRANPDLLHPLCRTYYRLVKQQDSDASVLILGKQVNVSFHHAAGSMTSLHGYAKDAAMWMDQRAKTAITL